MALQSDKNKSFSGGEKSPYNILLTEFKKEFELNHPAFFYELETGFRLTPQELLVCAMIRSDKKSKEIADLLNIALSTVGTHRTNIRKKMGLKKIGLHEYLLSNS